MPSSNTKPESENTCRDCLYLQRPPGAPHARCGNCALHKEWIASAARMTCSDMSNYRLQRGIYQLLKQEYGDWCHVRRNKRVRTRLFLVRGGGGQHAKAPVSQGWANRRKFT